ncbi:MAG: GntR family transcriptional regulator [Longicatena sp.]|jgi:GntR family transcriptional regulator|uniref:GntR family transcriptional regulator n=1 Tax=Anaerorhabdus sp. TaxID=1872524 RepID=UPI002FC68676
MINFDSNIPIYIQVMEYIKMEIVSGKLKTGDQVDTVREMAIFFGVNPNTIQRALQELEREGLLKSERTTGRFISATVESIEELKLKQGHEKTTLYLTDMKSLGFTTDETINLVKELKGDFE